MRWFWPVAVAPLLVGCVSSEFHPRYAAAKPKVTETAVQFYEGDIPAVRGAGGDILGTISTEGAPIVSYEALARSAASKGAERGGTHFMLRHSGTHRTYGPEKASTTCSGNNCETTFHQDVAEHPTSEFLIVRVEPEHWSELPEALRPQGLARKAQ